MEKKGGQVTSTLCEEDDTLWKAVNDDSTPPDGIGAYSVTNIGTLEIRVGIAQWDGREWCVIDGDIEVDEIAYCLRRHFGSIQMSKG